MKRRTFLEMLGATGATFAASDLAIASLAGYLEPISGRELRLVIWKEETFDFDNQFAIMAQFPDGKRHAIRIYERLKNVTPEMKMDMKRALLTWWRDKCDT